MIGVIFGLSANSRQAFSGIKHYGASGEAGAFQPVGDRHG